MILSRNFLRIPSTTTTMYFFFFLLNLSFVLEGKIAFVDLAAVTIAVCDIAVKFWPQQTAELLFFAIFGQTSWDNFRSVETRKTDSLLVTILFKLAFGIYMLVSVVVLINLLIAMMSDTYQRIQAQSDIEWKYGLSKLIRNMHRTNQAPSPLNLVTSWLMYLFRLCKKRRQKKERPSLIHMMGLRRSGQLSARSKMGAKWLSKVKKTSQVAHKDSMTLSVMQLSSLQSQLSFGTSNATRIESVIDWDLVRRKYRELHGGLMEKKPGEEDDEENGEGDSRVIPMDDATPSVVGSQATLIAASTP